MASNQVEIFNANQELSKDFIESSISESYKIELKMSKNVATKLTSNSTEIDLKQENTKTINDEQFYDDSTNKTLNSRATVKQVFPNIPCLPSENNIIFCFILSVWDNIIGPQTVYVWKKKSQVNLKKERKSFIQNIENEYVLGDSNEDEQFAELPGTYSIPSRNTHEESYIRYKGTSFSSLSGGGDSNEDEQFAELPGTYSIPSRNTHEESYIRYKGTSFSSLSGGASTTNHLSGQARKRLCLSTVVKYVTEHAIGVEECSQWRPNKMVSCLLTVPHQDIIILTVRFHIIEEGVGVPYSLSAVVPIQSEASLYPIMMPFMETMYRICAKVRLIITKDGLARGDEIRPNLQELCRTVSSLKEANLRLYPLTTLARMPDDRRMAERMLTSHLQTMGTTLVIADSPHEANQVVMWLGQFLSEEEMSNSRIALSDTLWQFQPELCVQAVIRDYNRSIDLPSSKLIASRRPLTLIDLGSSSVRQMEPMNVHAKNSCSDFRRELMALWHELDHIPAPSQSLFKLVETVAPMVKRFLYEWDRLASCEVSIRRAFLDAFLRSIQYVALSVIAWVRNEGSKEKRRRLSKSILQDISSTFLLDEADLKIVLAQAEKLETGFLHSLLSKKIKD